MSTRQTVRDLASPRRGRSFGPPAFQRPPDLQPGRLVRIGRSGPILREAGLPRRGTVRHAYLTPNIRQTLSVQFVWNTAFTTPKSATHALSLSFPLSWTSVFNNSTPPNLNAPISGTQYITMTPTTMPTPTIGTDGKPVQPWQPI